MGEAIKETIEPIIEKEKKKRKFLMGVFRFGELDQLMKLAKEQFEVLMKEKEFVTGDSAYIEAYLYLMR